MTDPTGYAIRPISRDEFPEYFRVMAETFGDEVRESEMESERSVLEPERTLATFDDGEIVGTAGIFSKEITLPGGQLTPWAGVTWVTVPPTHRRQGVLTALMRRQLTELFETSAEPVAGLWASEAPIYGRFGYGPATRGVSLVGESRRMRMRSDVDLGSGRMRLTTMDKARDRLTATYERARTSTVGWFDRPGPWWDYRFFDAEHMRHGATPYRVALYEEPDGEVTGYTVFRTNWDHSPGANGMELLVREVTATTSQAHAATWSFLMNMDLVSTIHCRLVPPDEPLAHMVVDPRALTLTVRDCMWVRIVDLGRALAARRYAQDVDLVFDVTDEFCPWNTGRWRLSAGPKTAECVRTADPADIALTSTELGAVYLGGTTFAVLAAAGRIQELRPGAVQVASRAFAHDREPWSPDVF